MACGSCGQRYRPVPPPPTYTVNNPVRGTTKGVIKKSKVQEIAPAPSSSTPVAGDAGPANNQTDNTTNGS